MTLQDIVELSKYAMEHTVQPGVVKTKREADLYTRIDKYMGIKHKWKVGDKYYILLCQNMKESQL